jgi:uncharacterized protein (DUF302 family)
MARTTDRLRSAAKKLTARADRAATEAKKKVRGKLRRRGARGVVREVRDAAAIAGAAALATVAVDEANRLLRKRGAALLAGKPPGFEIDLDLAPEAAIERVTDILKTEGFGILTRIDVQATLKEKLGLSFRPYVILGACNPTLAHRALSARAETGLLLPCNVTVEERAAGGSTVRIADPATMLRAGGLARDAELRAIAHEARERLARAEEALQAHAAAVVL